MQGVGGKATAESSQDCLPLATHVMRMGFVICHLGAMPEECSEKITVPYIPGLLIGARGVEGGHR